MKKSDKPDEAAAGVQRIGRDPDLNLYALWAAVTAETKRRKCSR